MPTNPTDDQNNQLALPDDTQIAQAMESLQTVRDGLRFFEQLSNGEIAPEEGQVENAIALMQQSSAQLEAFHAQYAVTMGGVRATIDTLREQRNEAIRETEDMRANLEEYIEEGINEHYEMYGDESWSEGYASAFEDYETLSDHVQEALVGKAESYAARLRAQGKIDEAERIEQLIKQAASTLKLADEAASEVENRFRQEERERYEREHQEWLAKRKAEAEAKGETFDVYDDDDYEDDEEGEFDEEGEQV